MGARCLLPDDVRKSLGSGAWPVKRGSREQLKKELGSESTFREAGSQRGRRQ